MKTTSRTAAIALAATLAACSTHYTRPGTTEAQMQKDLQECKALARGENPGTWTPEGPDYQARNSVGCPSGDCQAKPGQSIYGSPSVDLDRADRERAVQACMKERGYGY